MRSPDVHSKLPDSAKCTSYKHFIMQNKVALPHALSASCLALQNFPPNHTDLNNRSTFQETVPSCRYNSPCKVEITTENNQIEFRATFHRGRRREIQKQMRNLKNSQGKATAGITFCLFCK